MRPPRDAVQYRDEILRYRKRSYTKTLFQGFIYRFLEGLLTHNESDLDQQSTDLEEHTIATLTTFHAGATPSFDTLHFGYHELPDLVSSPLPEKDTSQVLFLKGHLPGSWIASVGAKYGIAYEFFRRHVHLWSSSRGPVLYAIPSLPSVTSRAGLALRFYTHGESLKPLKHKSLASRRIVLPESFLHGSTALTPAPGSTYIRGHTSFGSSHFFLEQDISIIIEADEGGGWTAILWSDIGSRSLIHSHEFHRFIDHFTACPKTGLGWIHLHPIAVLGLDRELLHELPTLAHGHDPISSNNNSLVQAASHLPNEFHLILDYGIAAIDPLYAIYPVLQFAATTSMSTLIAIIQRYDLISSTKWDPHHSSDNLEQLILQKNFLDDQVCRHEEVLCFWNAPKHNKWASKLTPEQIKVAEAAKKAVKDDYEYLIRRCRSFSEHHSTAITILTNTSALTESRKQIQLATQVTKLTILATVFLPLSFCTSIFGMNFIELENLRIWIWFVITAVVGIVTFLIYGWDERDNCSDFIQSCWMTVRSKFMKRRAPSKVLENAVA